jgi:putative YphP/YqiW family bacilliredoxin
MPYPEEMVRPMRAEVTALGVSELRTAAEVDAAMADTEGSALYFINSVCGCAAGSARPGLAASLAEGPRPDRMYTVFAGVDTEAVEAVRKRLVGIPPSSPGIALFKDGDLVAMIERHHIQRLDGPRLGDALRKVYAENLSG